MYPAISTSMAYYAPFQSPGYTGSSPYAVPEQPPFNKDNKDNTLSRHHSQWRSSSTSSTPSPSRKSSIFSRSLSRNSTSSTTSSLLNSPAPEDPLSRKTSSASTSSSLSSSIKSIFHRNGGESPEARAARKAEKQRRKKIEKSEREALERAKMMEASSLYMAWRYGDGSNTVSFAMY